jgi:hypothetical protein
LADGQFAVTEKEVEAVLALGAAFLRDELFDVVAEALQMAVDGRRAVVQRQVDGPSVAAGRYRQA